MIKHSLIFFLLDCAGLLYNLFLKSDSQRLFEPNIIGIVGGAANGGSTGGCMMSACAPGFRGFLFLVGFSIVRFFVIVVTGPRQSGNNRKCDFHARVSY